MLKLTNLSDAINRQLPSDLIYFMQKTGEIAAGQGYGLYLVGGVVRDLLLERTNLDIDLVVEGDAINLAHHLLDITQGKITTHPHFHTAKLRWGKWIIDLATARSETYASPGALPTVKPGSLSVDLFRRDFTINAMAINLNPDRYGRLIDQYGGQSDLEHKIIRILHERSFIDDATRIWRGIRYEQRLDFLLEPDTLQLLKRDIPMLDTISGDRIRHELELSLKEELPEKTLRRAEELGILAKLHPSLTGNGWLNDKFGQARKLSYPHVPPVGIYLSLLFFNLTNSENEALILYLRLPKPLAQILRDTSSLKEELELLAHPNLTPSGIYCLLCSYSLTSVTANWLASDSTIVRKRIDLFLDTLRYVKPALTGNDLQNIGVIPGPRMKEILRKLQEARLDGKATSKIDEERLVREWIERYQKP
ncbi:MAG: CCA tRNA nucleotidyltransferase [Dehalococcoidales bacterium]|nr:CCA tRNA nucleotidyltransferase [Dehalococcoidales bacterium]